MEVEEVGVVVVDGEVDLAARETNQTWEARVEAAGDHCCEGLSVLHSMDRRFMKISGNL